MRQYIDNYKCADCQKHKLSGKGYGLLPEQEVRSEPFEEVLVDLIGPWNITVCCKNDKFNALTSFDTVTNLVEIVRIEQKTSHHIKQTLHHIKQKFAKSWIAQYPWPKCCVHYNGGKFTG